MRTGAKEQMGSGRKSRLLPSERKIAVVGKCGNSRHHPYTLPCQPLIGEGIAVKDFRLRTKILDSGCSCPIQCRRQSMSEGSRRSGYCPPITPDDFKLPACLISGHFKRFQKMRNRYQTFSGDYQKPEI